MFYKHTYYKFYHNMNGKSINKVEHFMKTIFDTAYFSEIKCNPETAVYTISGFD